MYMCKRHIKMKPLMKSLLKQLHQNRPLSSRQLEVCIPFIERDLHGYSRKRIMDWFSCCLYDRITIDDVDYWKEHDPDFYENIYKPKVDSLNKPSSTLEDFFQ